MSVMGFPKTSLDGCELYPSLFWIFGICLTLQSPFNLNSFNSITIFFKMCLFLRHIVDFSFYPENYSEMDLESSSFRVFAFGRFSTALMVKPGIKVGGYNMNNIRYADDTVLIADNENELQEM